jgi:hypothetical protein
MIQMYDSSILPIFEKKLKKRSAFTPKARIIRLLGEELIGSDAVAFTELIKNSHDSDSTHVWIELQSDRDKNPIICIRDNGTGMDEEQFRNEWLQFGGSWKRDVLFTEKDRPILGQMGIGRFAADKLASQLFLITKSPLNNKELCAFFNWDKFDPHRKLLSESFVDWDLKKPEFFSDRKQGTLLVLKGLRSQWTDKKLTEIRNSLSTLIHPLSSTNKFKIDFKVNGNSSLSGPLNGFKFTNPHYKVRAQLEPDGVVTYQIENEEQKSFLWKENGGSRTGPVSIQVYAWDLEKKKDLREPISLEMRKILQQSSGILLFRDGFRVWPYGKNGNDWMGLDRRRVDNPSLHIGNNQLVGMINISGMYNPNLRDLSNRQGLRESEALNDLKCFVKESVLPPLEKYRRQVREQRQLKSIAFYINSQYYKKYKEVMNSEERLKNEIEKVEKNLHLIRKKTQTLNAYKNVLKMRINDLNLKESKQ